MRIWRKKEPAAGAACSQLRWPGAEWGMLSAVRLGAQGPLYRAVRAAVPAVDAAVGKIIRLAGDRWASTPFWTCTSTPC